MFTRIKQPAALLGLFVIVVLAACQADLGDRSIRPLGAVPAGALPAEQTTPQESGAAIQELERLIDLVVN